MAGKTIDMSRIKQLLQLKKLGLSNRQIAKELKISVYICYIVYICAHIDTSLPVCYDSTLYSCNDQCPLFFVGF